MKIALVQFEDKKLTQSFEKIADRVEKYISDAKKNNCRIISFPEDFWHSVSDYDDISDYQYYATEYASLVLNFLQSQALKNDIYIIGGTVIELNNGVYRNICSIIGRNGEIIRRYVKRRLVPYGFEKDYMKAGTRKFNVINIEGIKVGIMICRELFYPEIAREMRNQGVDIIFVLSYWCKRSNDYLRYKLQNKLLVVSEMRVVDSLCMARSIENECCICFINAAGNLRQNEKFDVLLGRTQVCIPFYGCIQKINQNKEGVIYFDFNPSILKDAGKAYSLFI